MWVVIATVSKWCLLLLLLQFNRVLAVVKLEDNSYFKLITNRIQNITCMHEDRFRTGRLFLCTNVFDITIVNINDPEKEEVIKLNELINQSLNTSTTTNSTISPYSMSNDEKPESKGSEKMGEIESGYDWPDTASTRHVSARLPIIGDIVQINDSAIVVSILNRNQLQLLTWTEDGKVIAECFAGKSCVDHSYNGQNYIDGTQFDASFNNPSGLLLAGNALYICQSSTPVAMRKMDLRTKYVGTVAEGMIRVADGIQIFPIMNPSSKDIYAFFSNAGYRFNLERGTIEKLSFHNLHLDGYGGNYNYNRCGYWKNFWGFYSRDWNCYSTASAQFVSSTEMVISDGDDVLVFDVNCKSVQDLHPSNKHYDRSYGHDSQLPVSPSWYQNGALYVGMKRGLYKIPLNVSPTVMCERDQIIMAISLSASIAFILFVGLIAFACVKCKKRRASRKEAAQALLAENEEDDEDSHKGKKQFKRLFTCRRIHCEVDCFVAPE